MDEVPVQEVPLAVPTKGNDDGEECSVCVAVHLRPLIDIELAEGCQECLYVTPGQPQVSGGGQPFTFDHVYGGAGGVRPGALYEQCVQPLVDGLFKGYNATVFAYGQTGSGKTFTMGSAFSAGDGEDGVIPRAMDTLFERILAAPDTDFTVRVGFVEIHQEQIRDLLVADATSGGSVATAGNVHIRELAGGGIVLAGASERPVSSKREMVEALKQGTLLRATASTNMNKRSSRSHAIFTITLEQRRKVPPFGDGDSGGGAGGGGRAHRTSNGDDGGDSTHSSESDEDEDVVVVDDYLCAKLHLVDLAGSERVKRTKAEGQRLKEGININKGLLALGNVISALSEGKAHVPYRDSKLTRMLQDSLGGNSRTLMIACVSPADVNLEESVNTLRYANRARNIRNKLVVNRDPVAAEIAHLRQQLAAARGEITVLRRQAGDTGGDGATQRNLFMNSAESSAALNLAWEEAQARNQVLELEVAKLKLEVESAKLEASEAHRRMVEARAERDALSLRHQQQRRRRRRQAEDGSGGGGDADAEDCSEAGEREDEGDEQELDIMKRQVSRIAELEKEVRRLKQVQRISGSLMVSQRQASLALDGGAGPGAGPLGSPYVSMPGGSFTASGTPVLDGSSGDGGVAAVGEGGDPLLHDDEETVVEEQAYRAQQAAVQRQLDALQQVLEAKESQMAQLVSSGGQMAGLRQQYDRVLRELEEERDGLQKERRDLLSKLQSVASSNAEDRAKLELKYREQLKGMDAKLRDLRKKERGYAQLEQLKNRSEATCHRLLSDIQAIKQQKVALHKQLERANKDFQEWKKSREREVLQLRAQGRKNAAQLQRLEALHLKQQAVLRRKTEEADAARRRLKEVQEVRENVRTKSMSSRPASAAAGNGGVECQPNPGAPLLRDERTRREWVERELDQCCSSYDMQRVLEGEKAQRSYAARQLKEVEKQLAAVRQPGGPTPTLAFPSCSPLVLGPGAAASLPPESELEGKRAELEERIRRTSAQILEVQQQLVRVKADEESRGGGAADARRWNSLRTVVEARALLKTVFRAASSHKAAAYECQVELSELREEADLLRLKLDIAEQELGAAKRVAAAAAVAMAGGVGSGSPASPDGPRVTSRDSIDSEVARLITEMAEAPRRLSLEAGQAPPPLLLPSASAERQQQREGEQWQPERFTCVQQQQQQRGVQDSRRYAMTAGVDSENDESEEEEQDDEESDDDDDDVDEWRPDLATPCPPKRRRASARPPGGLATVATAAAGAQVAAAARAGPVRQASISSTGGGANTAAAAWRRASGGGASSSGGGGASSVDEARVLGSINAERVAKGALLAGRLTKELLKEALTGKRLGGREWRAGTKTKADMLADYRDWMEQHGGSSTNGSSGSGSGGGGAAHLPAASRSVSNASALSPDALGVELNPDVGHLIGGPGTHRSSGDGSDGRPPLLSQDSDTAAWRTTMPGDGIAAAAPDAAAAQHQKRQRWEEEMAQGAAVGGGGGGASIGGMSTPELLLAAKQPAPARLGVPDVPVLRMPGIASDEEAQQLAQTTLDGPLLDARGPSPVVPATATPGSELRRGSSLGASSLGSLLGRAGGAAAVTPLERYQLRRIERSASATAALDVTPVGPGMLKPAKNSPRTDDIAKGATNDVPQPLSPGSVRARIDVFNHIQEIITTTANVANLAVIGPSGYRGSGRPKSRLGEGLGCWVSSGTSTPISLASRSPRIAGMPDALRGAVERNLIPAVAAADAAPVRSADGGPLLMVCTPERDRIPLGGGRLGGEGADCETGAAVEDGAAHLYSEPCNTPESAFYLQKVQESQMRQAQLKAKIAGRNGGGSVQRALNVSVASGALAADDGSHNTPY